MSFALTRRRALGAAAAAGLASCGGGDPPPTGRPQAGSGAGLLNSMLDREHAAVAAWETIGELLNSDGRSYARRIRAREEEHVERLSGLVRELGGAPPEGRPRAEYARMFPRMESEREALSFARDLEEQLVRTHLDALRSLPGEEQRRAVVQMGTEEAEDLAVVHLLSGAPAAPQAFVTGTS